MLKKIYKAITPPIIQSYIKAAFFKHLGYFSGPYPTWQHALKNAAGYDNPQIVEKVKDASLQVKNNPALFTRDGLIFTQPTYSYPLLAALLKIALEQHNNLRVLDFGGALGNTYFAFKNFYPTGLKLKWFIVEQAKMVADGKQLFQNAELSYHEDITALPEPVDVVLLSGLLQYMERPYELLEQLSCLKAPYLLIDRTWFSHVLPDQILVEHVPTHIYNGSYPCWLLNYSKMRDYLQNNYHIICEFDALEGQFVSNNLQIFSQGFFLKG